MNLKGIKINQFYTLFLGVFILLSSCSIQKKKYSKGYTFQPKRLKIHSSSVDESEIAFEENIKNKSVESISTLEITQNVIAKKMEASISSEVENTLAVPPIKRLASQLAEDCDVLTTMEGVEIRCIVVEVLDSEIKYKKCGFEGGPLISIKKKAVFMVKYRNGDKDMIEHGSSNDVTNSKQEKLALSSFILSLVGVVLYGVPAILGIIFGVISLRRIAESKGKKSGRGLALAGLIIGIVVVAVYILLLLLLL